MPSVHYALWDAPSRSCLLSKGSSPLRVFGLGSIHTSLVKVHLQVKLLILVISRFLRLSVRHNISE